MGRLTRTQWIYRAKLIETSKNVSKTKWDRKRERQSVECGEAGEYAATKSIQLTQQLNIYNSNNKNMSNFRWTPEQYY